LTVVDADTREAQVSQVPPLDVPHHDLAAEEFKFAQ